MKSAEDKTGKSFAFEVATPDATYYMHADSEKQKDEWIGAIGRCVGTGPRYSRLGSRPHAFPRSAIVRYSSAFTADDGYDDEED